jgi:divalent metal cation (Fe/Co/Zn/Cd) transporter
MTTLKQQPARHPRTFQGILPIALVVAIGLIEIALSAYCLHTGNIKTWGTTIVLACTLVNIAVIVYTINRARNHRSAV